MPPVVITSFAAKPVGVSLNEKVIVAVSFALSVVTLLVISSVVASNFIAVMLLLPVTASAMPSLTEVAMVKFWSQFSAGVKVTSANRVLTSERAPLARQIESLNVEIMALEEAVERVPAEAFDRVRVAVMVSLVSASAMTISTRLKAPAPSVKLSAVFISVGTGALFTAVTVTCTCMGVLDSAPSLSSATVVKAFNVPFALCAPVQ